MTETEAILILLCWCLIICMLTTCCCRCISKPAVSNPLNQIQMNNARHLTSTNNDQQSYSVPSNIVLNDLEYGVMYNPLREQLHQLCDARRPTILSFYSGLNYVEVNTSNVTTFSESSLDDPPPSYDEYLASCP